jgi:glycine/D-amino acid oxidase-like deaminating enzyme
MRVLIRGGGVVGASIAYFLSRRGVETIDMALYFARLEDGP